MSRIDARIQKRRRFVRLLACLSAVPGFAMFGLGLILIGLAIKRGHTDAIWSGNGIFIAAVGAVMGYSGVMLAMQFSASMISLACVGPAAVIWLIIAGLPELFHNMPLDLSITTWRMIASVVSTVAAVGVYLGLSKFLMNWTQASQSSDSPEDQTSSTTGVQR